MPSFRDVHLLLLLCNSHICLGIRKKRNYWCEYALGIGEKIASDFTKTAFSFGDSFPNLLDSS